MRFETGNCKQHACDYDTDIDETDRFTLNTGTADVPAQHLHANILLLLLPCLVQDSVFRCIFELFKSGGVHDKLRISSADWWYILLPLA